ncbi:MAG: DUF1080 domain-containing protein [Chloroflexota bacterium]
MTRNRVYFLSFILMVFASSTFIACGGGVGSEVESESANDSDLIYQDDFSAENVGRWQIERDELGSTEVNNGQLVIDVAAPNTLQFSTLEEPIFADFDLEVDGVLLDGSEDSTYGILYRMQSPTEFYRFEIMGDGHFMVERLDNDGTWTRFVDDWQRSDTIQVGVNANNHLRVVADGPSMTFYVNGELLQEIEDHTYISGNIGLDAGTYGHPKTRVAFDDLRVSPP